ncbi:MAG: mevalonate 3,5-bisphosphate decarboxylase [Thermoplasmataceae archaeon]
MKIKELTEKGEKFRQNLSDNGLFHKIEYSEPELEDFRETVALAYPIKAFEKFLGFYDTTEKIAFNSSISFNTDFSHCLSFCRYVREEGKDIVILDGKTEHAYTSKAMKSLSYFRSRFSIKGSFQFYVKRFRRYDGAKGMSESSAVAASVAKSLITNVFRSQENQDQMSSRFARLVSGSGTRACIDGLSLWLSYPGIDPDQSFAIKLRKNPMSFHYGIFPKKQSIVTDMAHESAVKSVFYETWIDDKYAALDNALSSGFDERFLMERGQKDSFNLHSVLLSSGLIVQTPESFDLLRKLLLFQKKNEGIFINADTGPSIMIASRDKSIISEFLETTSDPFLHGSFNFNQHEGNLNQFKRDSMSFFEKL